MAAMQGFDNGGAAGDGNIVADDDEISLAAYDAFQGGSDRVQCGDGCLGCHEPEGFAAGDSGRVQVGLSRRRGGDAQFGVLAAQECEQCSGIVPAVDFNSEQFEAEIVSAQMFAESGDGATDNLFVVLEQEYGGDLVRLHRFQ